MRPLEIVEGREGLLQIIETAEAVAIATNVSQMTREERKEAGRYILRLMIVYAQQYQRNALGRSFFGEAIKVI